MLIIFEFLLIIISFIVFIQSIIISNEILAVLMFCIIIFVIILSCVTFSMLIKKYPKNDISEYSNFDLGVIKENDIIKVNFENNIAICIFNNSIAKLNLKGFLFKKSFVMAYLNRQFKYMIKGINRKNLFKKKLLVKKYIGKNVKVLFEEKKEVYLIKNGILMQSILSQFISQYRYLNHYLFYRSSIGYSLEELNNPNEKKYIDLKL